MTQPVAGPIVTGSTAELRLEEAGLLACVHCGFCLNACPTYTRLGEEGDSPRGRLDLMRAVVEGRLEADDPAFRTHIDRCLGCRACEPVCPSGVPYGFLLERARSAIAESAGVPLSTRLLIAAYTGPFRGLVTVASRLLRSFGIASWFARHMPRRMASARFGLAMLASSAPVRVASLERSALERSARRGATNASNAANVSTASNTAGGAAAVANTAIARRTRIAILRGCVQQSLFARVNDATSRVLAFNGCDVVSVPGQRCCGALDAHAGRLDRARELARANIEAFEAARIDAVVVNAAGCGAMMKEYAEQLKHDPAWSERAESFVAKVRDVSEFLAERPLSQGGPVMLRVTYDAPCHLHHGQRIREAPLGVLDSIPGLDRVPLADADECCGGAGLYGVHHPELGGRVLADKVAAIRATGADAVLTPNPGCMMQIGAGLLLDGVDTVVMHPIEILDESYRRMEAKAK